MPDQHIILITGATGQQGGSILRELAGKGFTLRAMTRHPTGDAALKLDALGAQIVEGDLGLLAAGGDFASATKRCLGNGVTVDEIDTPAQVDRWYLVRPTFCQAGGSYDTGLPGQVASRDPGIAAAAVCP